MAGAPELADRGAYLPEADALVLADLHLGRDDQSNVELPLGERERIPERVAALVERFEPSVVVVAGDVLHAFDSVPDAATDALDAVREAVTEHGAELALVAGNHDAQLEAVVGDPVPQHYRLADETVVVHGDEAPTVEASRYVVGHEHPAIEIEGQRRPCYLQGPAADRDATVLVLPAFNTLTRGTVVNGARGRDTTSPLVGDLDRYRPAVYDPDADETLWFPRLEAFRHML